MMGLYALCSFFTENGISEDSLLQWVLKLRFLGVQEPQKSAKNISCHLCHVLHMDASVYH